MLPFFLVLLVAQSALALPSVSVSQYGVNEIGPVADNGKPSSAIDNALDILTDGGDTNIYIQTIRQIITDLGNQPDTNSQALAIGQSLAIIGELSYGTPGDACTAAALINAYTNSLSTGNKAGFLGALINFSQYIANNIDVIVQILQNPNSVRYASGRRGNCVGGGRTYPFEQVWDSIISNTNPYQTGLINEEYCATKRLYNAFNIRSNNVGAAVTAASIPPFNQVVVKAYGSLYNLLRAVAFNGNVAAAAATAKADLIRATASVQL